MQPLQIKKNYTVKFFKGMFFIYYSLFSFNCGFAQKKLVYSDHEPLGNMRTTFLNDVFFPAIEKESNGRIKIEAHWGGELAIAYEAFGAVKNGNTVNIATVVPEYKARELPLHQIFKSFIVGPTGSKQVNFFRKVFNEVPQFSQELQNNNLVPIFLSTGYPTGFYSREPIGSLKELRNNKWRTASFWHADFLRNVGASPVNIEWGPAVYEALENKTISGLMVNIDSGYDLKVYKQAPYLLASKDFWLGHLYLVTINKAVWEDLSENDKLAIQRAAAKSYKKLGAIMDANFENLIIKLKDEGVNVRILDKAEVRNFKEMTKYMDVQEKWVKEQTAKGINNAVEVLDKVRVIHSKTIGRGTHQ